MAIVWKAGAVSRVRFAAQNPRALDTAPAFQNKILLRRKRREKVARLKATALQTKDPSGLSLLPAKNGLDNGVHFSAAEWVERLAVDRANFEEFLAKTRALVCGTCVGIGRTQLGVAKNRYDWVVVDEAARATPTELAVAIQSGARILLVGDHRQLPPLYKQEVISHVSQVLGYHDRGALTRSDFQRAFLSSYGSEVGSCCRPNTVWPRQSGTWYPSASIQHL